MWIWGSGDENIRLARKSQKSQSICPFSRKIEKRGTGGKSHFCQKILCHFFSTLAKMPILRAPIFSHFWGNRKIDLDFEEVQNDRFFSSPDPANPDFFQKSKVPRIFPFLPKDSSPRFWVKGKNVKIPRAKLTNLPLNWPQAGRVESQLFRLKFEGF